MKFWPALLLSSALPFSLLLYASHAPDSPSAEPALAALPAEMLATLRTSDAVLPAAPPVHPVSTVYNREAVVPPQCYTKTNGYYNPCYTCHQDARPGRENVMNDLDLQEAYSFSEVGLTNHWKNLFEDRRERVAAISDAEIIAYVSQDNYSELPERLRAAGFNGWIPDLADLQRGADAFDRDGFARDGSHWVAYSYKPFPSTFWPTNGAIDDVMIRLPERFRTDRDGRYSRDVYRANLAIVEGRIKGLNEVGCLPVDERRIGRDLNGDGRLGAIERISNLDSYVGGAEAAFIDSHVYPEGVEFLHTVRYLDVSPAGEIRPSPRIKEVRYMRKWREYPKAFYARQYQLEAFDKEAGNLPGYQNLGPWGLDNGTGWSIQSFIESRTGRLRVATFEENLFCMGCHNSIGSTIDKTFSLARKVDGAAGWGYLNLRGMPDAPVLGESRGEFATYLERVGGGSEFRNNDEMYQRWFKDGQVDHEKVAAADVYTLITPSPARALLLNKAYRTIVEDQDFVFGRDATVEPPENVYARIDNATTPTLPADRVFRTNIVLDWAAATAAPARDERTLAAQEDIRAPRVADSRASTTEQTPSAARHPR
jgi:hypothetical protein